jgi:RHS repeat-associated protein
MTRDIRHVWPRGGPQPARSRAAPPTRAAPSRAPRPSGRALVAVTLASLFTISAFGLSELRKILPSAPAYPTAVTARQANAPKSNTSRPNNSLTAKDVQFSTDELKRAYAGSAPSDPQLAAFRDLPSKEQLATAPNGDTNPLQPSAAAPAPAFDPQYVDAYTKVSDAGNGKANVSISAVPERVQVDGQWVPIDNTVADTGTVLMPKAATLAPEFTRTGATGPDYSFASSAGRVAVSYPGSSPSTPVTRGDTVVYPGALGGRDLVLTTRSGGIEESVVVARAEQGNAYEVAYTLPKGVTAAATKQGVEFRSGKTIVFAVTNSTAWDAQGTKTTVTVALTRQRGNVARLRVAVDADWLTAPDRAFPVTIDPTVGPLNMTLNLNSEGGGWTSSPTTCWNFQRARWENCEDPARLSVGTYFDNGGGANASATYNQGYSDLGFNLGYFQNAGNVRVEQATLVLAPVSGTCTDVVAVGLTADPQVVTGETPGGCWLGTKFFDLKNLVQRWVYKDPPNTPAANARQLENRGIRLQAKRGIYDAFTNCTISPTTVPAGGSPNLSGCPSSTDTWQQFERVGAKAPRLNLTVEYVNAQFPASQSWQRFSNGVAPTAVTMKKTVKNTGAPTMSKTWTPKGNYRLEALYSQNGKDWTTLGLASPTADIAPGTSGTFTLTASKKLGPGTYWVRWTIREDDPNFPANPNDPFCGPFDAKFMCYAPTASTVDLLTVTSDTSFGANPSAASANGVNTFSGNYTVTEKDVAITGIGPALEVARTYNSLNDTRIGAFGRSWSTTIDMHIGWAYGLVATYDATGGVQLWADSGDGINFTPQLGASGTLVRMPVTLAGDVWTLTDHTGTKFLYAGANRGPLTGKLLAVTDFQGRSTVFKYNLDNGTINQMYSSVSNRALSFTWDTASWPDHPLLKKVSTDSVTTYNERGQAQAQASKQTYSWNFFYEASNDGSSVPSWYLTAACGPSAKTLSAKPYSDCTEYTYAPQVDSKKSVLTNRLRLLATVQSPMSHKANNPQGRDTYDLQLAYFPSDAGSKVSFLCDARTGTTKCANAPTYRWAYQYSSENGALYRGSITDPNKNITAWDYDAGGRITTVTNADGTTKQFAYELTDAQGNITNDNNHFLSQVTDEMGNTISYETDGNGNVTRTRTTTTGPGGPASASDSYATYWNNRVVGSWGPGTSKDPRPSPNDPGNDNRYLTTTIPNADGTIAAVIGPANGDGKRTWDVKRYTDGTEPVPVGATYGGTQPKGLVRKACAPTFENSCDRFTLYDYDRIGQLVRTVTPAGVETRFEYDELGRMFHKYDNCPPGSPCNGQRDWYQIFDANGNVTSAIEPVTSDKNGLASGALHQLRTDTTYDKNGRVIQVQATDTKATTSQKRTATTTYDEDGRTTSVTDPAGLKTLTTYDAVGNVATVTGPTGLKTQYTYDNRNRRTDTWIKGFVDDPIASSPARDIRVSHVEYDKGSRKISETDALGTTLTYRFTADGLVASTTISSYRPDAATQWTDQQLSATVYDATRRVTTHTAFDGNKHSYTTTNQFDPAGHLVQTTSGPASDPTTTKVSQFDPFGNAQVSQTWRTSTQGSDRTKSQVSCTDTFGRLVLSGLRVNQANCGALGASASELATHTRYDERGNVIATEDATGADQFDPNNPNAPLGDNLHVTRFAYDELGRAVKTMSPQVNVEQVVLDSQTDRAKTTSAKATPTSITAYDGFGQTYLTIDASGAQRKTTYDSAGRPIRVDGTDPSVSVGSPAGLITMGTTTYDAKTGLVKSTADAMGRSTTLRYDALGRVILTVAPPDLNGKQAQQRVWYDDLNRPVETGSPLAQAKDPNAFDASTWYNELGRPIQTTTLTPPTSIDAAQHPTVSFTPLLGGPTLSTNAYVTTTSTTYDLLGRAIKTVAPDGTVTTPTFDAHGRTVATTTSTPTNLIAPQVATINGFDTFGNVVQSTNPLGVVTTASYDAFGRTTGGSVYAPGNTTTPIARTKTDYSYAGRTRASLAVPTTSVTSYDANAMALSATNPPYFANQTTMDNAGRMTNVQTPAGTTNYGYDFAGRMVRATDGRNNSTYYTYNPAGLAEATIEPATADTKALAQRTYLRRYDAVGNPVTDIQPGGVSVTRSYKAGALTTVSAQGGGLANASRSFNYDLLGRTTSFSSPQGDYNIEFDARGQVAKVDPPSGRSQDAASYQYDNLGRLTSQQDTTGTHGYSYNAAGLVSAISEPLTGTTETYAYNQTTGQPTSLTFTKAGASTTESFGYDPLGRVNTKTFTAAKSATPTYALSIDQRDANGNVLKQSIGGTNATGAGQYAYTYDTGGRLATYAAPNTAAVAYGYDAAGNRTKAGETDSTYDNRNRLTKTSAGDKYTYNERGDLTKSVEAGKTTGFAYDALGRLTTAGDATYTYDALDRVNNRNSTQFSYIGATSQLARTGSQVMSYLADGTIDAVSTNGTASLAIQNGHGDLAATFDPGATSTKSSTAYDPFGKSTTNANDLGFQGQYTDPTTGLVWMNARWYSPTTGTFGARDSVLGDTTQPASMNRYAYANGNPVMNADPSGRCVPGSCMTSGQAASANNVTGGNASSCGEAGMSNVDGYGAVVCGNVAVFPNGSMQYSSLWATQSDVQKELNGTFSQKIGNLWSTLANNFAYIQAAAACAYGNRCEALEPQPSPDAAAAACAVGNDCRALIIQGYASDATCGKYRTDATRMNCGYNHYLFDEAKLPASARAEYVGWDGTPGTSFWGRSRNPFEEFSQQCNIASNPSEFNACATEYGAQAAASFQAAIKGIAGLVLSIAAGVVCEAVTAGIATPLCIGATSAGVAYAFGERNPLALAGIALLPVALYGAGAAYSAVKVARSAEAAIGGAETAATATDDIQLALDQNRRIRSGSAVDYNGVEQDVMRANAPGIPNGSASPDPRQLVVHVHGNKQSFGMYLSGEMVDVPADRLAADVARHFDLGSFDSCILLSCRVGALDDGAASQFARASGIDTVGATKLVWAEFPRALTSDVYVGDTSQAYNFNKWQGHWRTFSGGDGIPADWGNSRIPWYQLRRNGWIDVSA